MADLTAIRITVLPVLQALQRDRVPHYIGGSVASSIHGIPRTTVDIDMVADLSSADTLRLAQRLEATYYADQAAMLAAVHQQQPFNVIHLETMMKIDVFAICREHDETALSRVVRVRLDPDDPASELPLASPEDIILRKLEWYRLGGEASERQWLDVLGVLKVQGDALDDAYLDRWAHELNVADLLERARDLARPS